jgi:hypothetical protein
MEELKRQLSEVEGKIGETGKMLNKQGKRDGRLRALRPHSDQLRAEALPVKMGAPKLYPPEHPCWLTIINGIRNGGSLSLVLERNQNMPSGNVVRDRIAKDLDFQARYEKALQDRADRLAEEILEISDSEPPAGLEAAAMSAWVADKRLRVDARKWVAAKLQPKRYGDRIDVAVTDTRISVMDALTQAKQRVLTDTSNVVDVESRDVEC